MKIIRRKKLVGMTGLSYSSINRWEKHGLFPKRIQLGSNSVGWYEHEVIT